MGLLWLNGSTGIDKFVANSGNLGCVKCSNEEVLCFELNSEKSLYCEECFLRTLKWKFRSALSRRNIFKDNASRRVVVVLDGSRESAFLFRQIEYAMKQKSQKRLLMEPYFILMLYSMDASEIKVLQKNLCILRQVLSSTYFVVHLAAVFGELRVDDDSTCQGLEHLPKLIELSKSFRTTSMREEMMRILKVRLLLEFSRCIGISKVMTSCNSDVLGRLVLNQLCLGRGGRVSNMTDVVEKTVRGTTFIRPLRDFSSQEILTALRLEKVEHYVLSPCFEPLISPLYYAYEASTEGSIQRSTAAFLNRLVKKGFKDTIPTLLSVANRIHISDGTTMCAVCEYSFSGNGQLCYTCSAITNELPFPNIVHIYTNQ